MSGLIELLIKEYPQRSFALKTSTHVLILRHTSSSTEISDTGSQASNYGSATPQCMVEFTTVDAADLEGYRSLRGVALNWKVHGTLGLITLNNDVFLCVVSGVTPRPITIRPGETVRKIESVDFHCLNSSNYDRMLNEQVNHPYSTDYADEEGYDERGESGIEHPCLSLKKLLSGGTFYYSSDFDLTRRLQKRITDEEPTIAIESFDAGFLWNSYMIQPLIDFRSRLSQQAKDALDGSRIITSAIRGYCAEMIIPATSSPLGRTISGEPARLTLVSRLSCRRAGTRFNARGIDDEGNVANFVETETTLWSPTGEETGECFSYIQVRGSLPIFWEQASSLNPLQPAKITIVRSVEATQPAFDKHFENMDHSYGAVHIINLLSSDRKKQGEIDLTDRYYGHVLRSPLYRQHEKDGESEHNLLEYTHYDFHAETQGRNMAAASGIVDYISSSVQSFNYLYAEDREEHIKGQLSGTYSIIRKGTPIIQQEGAFRTNCLDCLDRTNFVQTIISQLALENFLTARKARPSPDFWARHSTLWADNGDALSKMYAGTGALNTSVTRHGKSTFGGLLSDVRKSVQRVYINNVLDGKTQNTIDIMLGRLMGQKAVHLYDPISDWVQMELKRRASEYTSMETIQIQVGTFNLNGKLRGLEEDLSPWLCPPVDPSQRFPEIVALGFQEIVELNPQTVMSEDPHRLIQWAAVVQRTLNEHAAQHGSEEYVLLRKGQLVGAALLILVKASVLPSIKNVEGAIKKTGISGLAGNKGAVAIRMDVANTSLCFVTAHLAAGFSNYEERNKDYRTISQGLRFQRNRAIDDHDSVIWFGDFNYRIGLSNEKVRHFIDRGDIGSLFDNDQLYIQRTRSNIHDVFDHYDESRITFLPTYKYDIGTDTYDTSDKGRIPAWTDRVLRKGLNLRQIHYDSAPLRFSDHRPVYATFQCDVSMVNEASRDELNLELYRKRKDVVGARTASANVEPSEDEDLIGYESVPPAKSNPQRWWLDNGLPAQTTIRPPGKGFVPNPKRDPNPFVPSDEQDWVKVDNTGSSNVSRSPSIVAPISRRQILPPPSNANALEPTPQLPPRRPTMEPPSSKITSHSATPPSTVLRSSSVSSSSSIPSRKPAPPVPKKPSILSNPVLVDGATDSSRSSTVSMKSVTPPSLPPPRRSMAPIAASGTSRNGSNAGINPRAMNGEDGDRPSLPPRTGLSRANTKDLLDEKDEEGLNGLRDWEVLKPG